jgi:hypothetical protein
MESHGREIVLSSQLEKVDEISVSPVLSTGTPKLLYDVSTIPTIGSIRIKLGVILKGKKIRDWD